MELEQQIVDFMESNMDQSRGARFFEIGIKNTPVEAVPDTPSEEPTASPTNNSSNRTTKMQTLIVGDELVMNTFDVNYIEEEYE